MWESVLIRTGLACTLLAVLATISCQGSGVEEEPPPPIVLEEVIEDERDEDGVGAVLVRLEDEGVGVYFFDGSGPYPVLGGPVPISKKFVELQHHVIELPNGKREDRWVLVTQTVKDPRRRSKITVYGPDPKRPGELRELDARTFGGEHEGSLVNETTGEKTLLFGKDGWLMVRLLDGAEVGRSGNAAPPHVKSIEIVLGFIIVIETWNHETDIRVHIYSPIGQVVSSFVMPGDYVDSLATPHGIKAVVTRHAGRTVFMDLIEVRTGTRLTQPAHNGMDGEHAHLQYDPVGGGRFVEIVYNRSLDETFVQVYDPAGQPLALSVLPGKYKSRVGAGQKPVGYKVIATERDGRAAATVIDLVSGRQGSITQGHGPYESLASGAGGVTLRSGGVDLAVKIP